MSVALVTCPLATVPAGGEVPSAEADFRSFCSACHGEDGRSAGAKAFGLSVEPPDLTTLTLRNDGIFPRERLRQIIDGREDIKSHVDREMPVWGQIFRMDADEELDGSGEVSAAVKERIERLIDFIETLQR